VIKAVAPRLGAYGDLDADSVLELCGLAKLSGYAVTGNHAVPGVRAIGLPIFNTAGSPIAAITVAATHARMTDQRIAHILPRLRTPRAS
jgi:DNA-binding IclR family transcriptional regulator